ncbi:MAG: Membrane-associated zinc metalloprotease [uncultured Sulfurovum sp.]|uniref:Zinc metalloprotease n=1 Tax=uncultured Sulfurovum sp. TaxID=269237 RepID=A0A6S6T781_9BACT|nr:MAG: Membrane-associated zinc metalloprotease [uncultured Sulfurovum sp.]
MLIALLVFSFLIFFHELGHFLAARFFGVHVEVFSIGFGKRILTKKFGATEWSISLIPLGGYVRMKGQDDSDPSLKSYDEDSYNAKTPFQRIIISLAGPFANFLLAFLLYLSMTFIGLPKILTTLADVNTTHPAYKAGIRTGDTITSINGTPTIYWEDVSQNIHQEAKLLNVTVLREGQYIDLKIMPIEYKTKNRFGEIKTRYIIGVSADQKVTQTIHYTLENGLDYAYNKTIDSSMYIFNSLKKLVMGEIPLENLGGPVGILNVTSQVSQMGIVFLLAFAALISVNLGVINLLPIPALDGGHVMFHTYELISKKPANEDIMFKLTLLGWSILLSLMLLGLYNDINRLLE